MKPGNEAELDSLVQDSIRLATSIKVSMNYANDMSNCVKANIMQYFKRVDEPLKYCILQDSCSELCEKSYPTVQCKYSFSVFYQKFPKTN